MNFIDAHKIVHDYVDVIAKGVKEKEPARRLSELKNNREEISMAFYIFFGHMFIYGTRTQEEYERYKNLRYQLQTFADDKLIDEYMKCEKIINDKGILARFKYKDTIPYVKEKRELLLKQILSGFSLDEYERVGICIDKIHDAAINVKKKIENLNDNKQIGWELGNYCCDVYEIAEIPREYDDTEYFWPFSMLRKFANDPELVGLYGKYKNYILTNRWD